MRLLHMRLSHSPGGGDAVRERDYWCLCVSGLYPEATLVCPIISSPFPAVTDHVSTRMIATAKSTILQRHSLAHRPLMHVVHSRLKHFALD